MNTKESLKKRLKVLEQEIVMGAYYDGWTLKGIKEEYKTKRDLLKNHQ
jgi:hypothetical protein